MKKLITTALAALFGMGIALAGPVVVTPGSVAGYMYIEGSGASSSVLPVVTENAACTATTTSNTGINSTFTKVMTCNGGAWKPISVGALQTVTAGAACTASATNNIGVDSGFTKAYMCVSGTWAEYSPTAKSVQTVAEGSACTASATNNVAVSADYQLLLTCQSGVWRRDPAAGCPAGKTYTGGACVSIAAYASGTWTLAGGAPCGGSPSGTRTCSTDPYYGTFTQSVCLGGQWVSFNTMSC